MTDLGLFSSKLFNIVLVYLPLFRRFDICVYLYIYVLLVDPLGVFILLQYQKIGNVDTLGIFYQILDLLLVLFNLINITSFVAFTYLGYLNNFGYFTQMEDVSNLVYLTDLLDWTQLRKLVFFGTLYTIAAK